MDSSGKRAQAREIVETELLKPKSRISQLLDPELSSSWIPYQSAPGPRIAQLLDPKLPNPELQQVRVCCLAGQTTIALTGAAVDKAR